ncbi:MAG: MFS transporter [Desulfovibrionales bacterium]
MDHNSPVQRIQTLVMETMLNSMDQRERRILYSVSYGHFLSHFNMLAFPAVVLPLTETLSLDLSGVLGLSFFMYFLFGVTALPWGLLADRVSPGKLFLCFYIGAGLCGLAAALTMDSPLMLTVSLAGIGLFSGIYHPLGLGIISKEIKKVSLGMGFNGMFGNLGLAAAPFVMGLFTWIWGPAVAYGVLGGMNLLGAAFFIVRPLEVSIKDHRSSGSVESTGALKPFLVLLVAMMLGGVVYRGATVLLPAYLELKSGSLHQWVTSLAGAGLTPNLLATTAASTVFIVGMAGQYAGGHLAQRFRPKYAYLGFHGLTVPLAFLAAMVSDLALLGVIMAYFFFLLGMQPAENTLVARLSPARLRHSAFGFKFILTFGVGALAVSLVGLIQESFSLEAVYPSLGLISILLVGSILVLIRVLAGKKGE